MKAIGKYVFFAGMVACALVLGCSSGKVRTDYRSRYLASDPEETAAVNSHSETQPSPPAVDPAKDPDGAALHTDNDPVPKTLPQEDGAPPKWAYDPGPNLQTPEGHDLVDINSQIPYFPGVSQQVMGDQKFRPAFGPIPWRMLQKPNSVKILFIGQDGTHIAEAAGRPATAGFGGRAQDLAKYFGVSSSAAFMNTYAFTIRGQYGTFDTPVIHTKDGKTTVSYSAFVGNQLWLMSQDQSSPIVQWRNKLIEWIIRNNKKSLKMIVLFGGGARDAASAFIESEGGTVGARTSSADLVGTHIPETQLTSTGGNNESPVPLSVDGKDLYEEVLGHKPNYTNPKDLQAAQDAFKKAVESDPDTWLKRLAISKGGLSGSGVVHPAQLGGYDIAKRMKINGQSTISLKGMVLKGRQIGLNSFSSDLTIDHDLLVVQLPHPTALSTMTPDQASQKVGEALVAFKPYVNNGWKIDADPGFTNNFANGQPYKYARADMGPEYYDFGAPASRMVNVSSASRMSSNVIVFGTRDKAGFDQGAIKQMTDAKPTHQPTDDEMWIARPRSANTRYIFDPGPGAKYAKLMIDNLPDALINSPKHSVNGDFGHYRGTFNHPKVVILADPDGYDDLITARALTGTRGQYLNRLMEDLGVRDQYLVIKTAPFSLVESDQDDWDDVMKQTQAYREALLKNVLKDGAPKLIIADGKYAGQEVDRILGPQTVAPVVKIERQTGPAGAGGSGISLAALEIKKIADFAGAQVSGKMSDIPRSHLSYYARVWEGTSGDRVITSTDAKYAGQAFAEVAPKWAFTQAFKISDSDEQAIQSLIKKETDLHLRKGGETVQDYLKGE